ncbi:hypothetical protein BMI91_09125 [Thioclava sediminum]|uniref:Type IV pilus biogenesis protein PilP n=1 Tax=Thioclava sediminum TaxID=1915319 RepID=A0ABX3MXF8_9RHOB|nr:hypothetical protein [Thioclava sediminum]OOY24213.1 hypothetical protein BMI91_09125 [Thioclava sediminum]
MKPDFALILSHDGIALVHRAKEGWTLLGEAALEGDDPMAEVAALRDKARAQAPRGFTSKLVLPDSQILYTAIYAPGPSPAQRKTQIETALEGMTPYPVSELVYDFAGPGQTVQVAVIARETLKEAESFAQENGFNPVSFVAAPEPGDFPGEPHFGLTSSVAQHIPEGAHVEPDKSALIVAVDLSEEATEASAGAVMPEAPAAEAAPADTQSDITDLADDSAVSETELAELSALDQPTEVASAEEYEPTLPEEPGEFSDLLAASEAETDAQDTGTPETPSEDTPGAESPAAKAAEAVAAGEVAAEETEATDAVEFAKVEPNDTSIDDAEAGVEPSDASLAAAGLAATPAVPDATEPDAKPEEASSNSEDEGHDTAEDDDDDLPKSDASVIAAAFASRRDHTSTVTVNETPPRLGGATRLHPQPDRSEIASGSAKITAPTLDFDEPDPRFEPKTAPKTGAKGTKAVGTAARKGTGGAGALGAKPSTSLLRKEAKDGPDPSTATPAPIVETSQDKTVFGGTKRPTTGGKPRHLGLMLTGALVLVLAIIALWTTLLDDPAPVDAPADAIAEAPAPDANDAPEQTALAPATPDTTAVPEAAEPDSQAQADAAPEQPALESDQVAALAPADEQPAPAAQSDEAATPATDDTAATDEATPAETDTETAATEQPTDTQPADTATADQPADTQPDTPDTAADTAADTAPNTQAAATDRTPDTQADAAISETATSDAPQSDTTEPPASDAQTATTETQPSDLPAFTATPLDPPSAETLTPDTPPVTPTEDGVEMPGGFTLFAGEPDVTPGSRPEAVAQAYAATQPVTPEGTLGAIPSLSGFRPASRPEDLTGAAPAPEQTAPAAQADPNDQGALDPALQPNPELQTTRPTARPDAVTELASTQAPASESAAVANPELAALRPERRPTSIQEAVSAAVQAQDDAVAENTDPFAGATALAVARSATPPTKPRNFSRSVEKALAAAIAAEPAPSVAAAAARAPVATPVPDPRPADLDEPEPTAAPPRLPTSASVARQATEENVINLRKINLIGLYGSSSNRRALVRLSNGRFVKVGVGDRLDGGRVTQIGSNALTYKKGSRNLTLKLLQGG